MNGALRSAVSTMAGISVVSGLFFAPSAQAACTGYGCDGKDPIAEGCNADAYTVDVKIVPNQSLWVELRYSPKCGTNWSRTGSSYSMAHNTYIARYGGSTQSYSGYGTGVYTNMLVCIPTCCTARTGTARHGRASSGAERTCPTAPTPTERGS